MNEATPEQFADSVRAAIGTVREFYAQIDRLNDALLGALTTDPDRLTVLGGLPPKPAANQNFRVVRYDYGVVYHGGTSNAEDGGDEDADGDDEDGGVVESAPPKAKILELFPDQAVVPVRTILYHPSRPDELEPQIVYAVLSDWRCGEKKTMPKEGKPFRIKPYMVSRMLRAVHHGMSQVDVGERLTTKATVMGGGHGRSGDADRALSARLCGKVQSVRLYDLDGSGAVDDLAARIKAYWRERVASFAGP